MCILEFSYYEESWLIDRPCRDLQQLPVIPESLGLPEIDTVLGLVACAFFRVKFKTHGNIKFMPFPYTFATAEPRVLVWVSQDTRHHLLMPFFGGLKWALKQD